MTFSSADATVGYEQFFGFRLTPFGLAPDTRFVFQSASHRAALAQLTYALERREPVVVVTGEIGTGKTLLCRTVLERLDRKTFVSTVNDPRLERDDLLRQMLLDFGVLSKDRTTWTPASRHDLVHALQDFLTSIGPLHAHAAVIIDEAQHVRPDVLEDVRLVANVQDQHATLLQIILAGQDSLEELLARPELRQLQQRVSRHVRLEPLSETEVADYIGHRLAVAHQQAVRSTFPGASQLQRELAAWQLADVSSTFTPEAVREVARLSRGIPRVVNLLCDRALEAAFARRSRNVDEPIVIEAARALALPAVLDELAVPPPPTSRPVENAAVGAPAKQPPAIPRVGWGRRPLLAAGAFVVAVAAFWLGSRALNSPEPPASGPETGRTVQTDASAKPGPSSAAPKANASELAGKAPAPAASLATRATSGTVPPPAGDAFEIVVASFRTASRAEDVARQVSALGEPVRVRSASGWQQVVAGPYPSRGQGQDARQRLTRAGFAGTQLGPAKP